MSANKCSPKTDCNVCKECCQDYIENGDECNQCYEENCKNYCDTSVEKIDVEVDNDGNPIGLFCSFLYNKTSKTSQIYIFTIF